MCAHLCSTLEVGESRGLHLRERSTHLHRERGDDRPPRLPLTARSSVVGRRQDRDRRGWTAYTLPTFSSYQIKKSRNLKKKKIHRDDHLNTYMHMFTYMGSRTPGVRSLKPTVSAVQRGSPHSAVGRSARYDRAIQGPHTALSYRNRTNISYNTWSDL